MVTGTEKVIQITIIICKNIQTYNCHTGRINDLSELNHPKFYLKNSIENPYSLS